MISLPKLFKLSISENFPKKYLPILELNPELRKLVTFELSKEKPIHSWFHFKEGFSPDLFFYLMERFLKEESEDINLVIDPFCGVGTTLLSSQDLGIDAIGLDVSPLMVFVSNTKLQRGYDMKKLKDEISYITSLKYDFKHREWPQIDFINIKKAFRSYVREEILFFREKIMEIEDEKIRNLFLLALLSIIIPVSRIRKDGGVLKIYKRRNIPPVRVILKNKLKKMYKDLNKVHAENEAKANCFARLGDARKIDLEKNSADFCLTSPPYLNWVDYTKVYALELSLLVPSLKERKKIRSRSFRSYLPDEKENFKKVRDKSQVLDSLMEFLAGKDDVRKPLWVIDAYFSDIFSFLKSLKEVLANECIAAIVVSNTSIPYLTIDTDIILAELSESLGFEVERIIVANVRKCVMRNIKEEKPVRESIVLIRKV